MITHTEPDILECEVKWALESITTNKASGGDGIPVELLQILKDDAVKVLHSICQQIYYFFLILKSLILTCIPKYEPPSHLPPHNISLGHPHAPAPSMLHPASDIDW